MREGSKGAAERQSRPSTNMQEEKELVRPWAHLQNKEPKAKNSRRELQRNASLMKGLDAAVAQELNRARENVSQKALIRKSIV